MRTNTSGIALAAVALLVLACDRPQTNELPVVRAVVESAIETHGGDVLRHARVTFDFRQYHFEVTRDGGVYSYERTHTNDGKAYREVLDNHGITRAVDGVLIELTDDDRRRLLTPLNSVPYFALLPFNLSDPATIPKYLGETTIGDEPYHEIEVRFAETGGGKDFEDRFVYWFHRDRHTMDYLAYTFRTGDGGTRFREAHNVRRIGGVLFQDYHNYVSDSLATPDSPIEQFDELYQSRDLELLSEIELTGISVHLLHP